MMGMAMGMAGRGVAGRGRADDTVAQLHCRVAEAARDTLRC
jgi:hypothetical protein